MADDDVALMTNSELEIYRRNMFLTCFPKGSHLPRERLLRDILLLKAVSNSTVGADAVEMARKRVSGTTPVAMRTDSVPVGDDGDTMIVPQPPLRNYNKDSITRITQARRSKKAAAAAAALIAANNELESDTMAIKVPGTPATKRTAAVEPATARILAPKPPSVPDEEKSKAVRKPRAKKETKGVVKAEPVPAAPAAPPEAPNPFSRYVRPS